MCVGCVVGSLVVGVNEPIEGAGALQTDDFGPLLNHGALCTQSVWPRSACSSSFLF